MKREEAIRRIEQMLGNEIYLGCDDTNALRIAKSDMENAIHENKPIALGAGTTTLNDLKAQLGLDFYNDSYMIEAARKVGDHILYVPVFDHVGRRYNEYPYEYLHREVVGVTMDGTRGWIYVIRIK